MFLMFYICLPSPVMQFPQNPVQSPVQVCPIMKDVVAAVTCIITPCVGSFRALSYHVSEGSVLLYFSHMPSHQLISSLPADVDPCG